MSRRSLSRIAAFLALPLVAAFVVLAATPGPARPATPEALGGTERYLACVSTDKPIYRSGETLYVRGVILNALDNTPLKAGQEAVAMIEVLGPKGETVTQGSTRTQDSVAGFAWTVPAGQAGGEYKVKMSFPWQGYPPAERTFDIRAYRAPRLKSQITFLRDGYGPGDKVTATLETKRAEGGIPAGARVTVYARVDGAEAWTGPAAVDTAGYCTVSFPLPAEIARGEGTLAFAIEDGGVVETATKTIPILLQTVDLALYPEGGDLVAGLPTRVSVEARTPAQKPADIVGVIKDAAGKVVAEFKTAHEGRGRFALLPAKDAAYTLHITEPAGIRTTYPLPAVKPAGAILQALADRFTSGAPVKLRIGASTGGELKVTLSRREKEVGFVQTKLEAYEVKDVDLTPLDAEGVLVATLWNGEGTPLAERLVFVEPAQNLQVAVFPEGAGHVPGGTVTLKVKTRDQAGKPVSAVVGLTVTDDSVLEMIETREQAPRLPAMALLESDVRELADARVYLDPKDPQAPLALDLLLGTQGWRRFAFVKTEDFLRANGDAARRVLALTMARREEVLKAAGGRMRGMPMEDGAMVFEGAPAPAAAPGLAVQAKGEPEPPVERMAAADKPEKPRAEARREREEQIGQAGERGNLREALEDAEKKRDAPFDRDERARRAQSIMSEFVMIREYAHKKRPDRQPGDRRDFAETLYWAAGVKTDANGEASVSFDLSDAVTSFRVLADAFGANGALGAGTNAIESVEPFHIEPKFPLAVTTGDVIRLPVSFVNAVGSDLDGAGLAIEAPANLQCSAVVPFNLEGDGRPRRLVEIRVGPGGAGQDLVLKAKAGPYADTVTRALAVEPRGFPIEVGAGGLLGPNAPLTKTVVIPNDVQPGSLKTRTVVYPTPLANMQEALERLLQEPNGCFEQTSSTNYPVIMAQQYFESHTGVNPQFVRRGQELLDRGYKKLTSFECDKKGYEWFGEDPGHEALTAYGLLEFTDMAKAYTVAAGMLANTQQWLLKQRDGAGAFKRGRRALHTWIQDADCSNSYITWAALECGVGKVADLSQEVETVRKAGRTSANSYVTAVAANVLSLAGDADGAKDLMNKLKAAQQKDGSVGGATTSIVGSGGDALAIETTSFAALAWLRDKAYAGEVEKAIRYLADSCKAGRYGSTQSTVLALRAVIAYDQSRARPKAPGTLQVFVDGKAVEAAVAFDEKTEGAITLPDLTKVLTPGEHQIRVEMDGGSEMPFSFAVNYHSEKPATSPECKVGLVATLRDETVVEGAITEMQVEVTNRTQEAIPTPVAIVGVPGGLEPRHDQLKELKKAGTIAAYEVIGRDVVLYWRDLAAGQTVKLPISLVAAVPGVYTGPASRAYLYYTDEFKTWVDGMRVDIQPRDAAVE